MMQTAVKENGSAKNEDVTVKKEIQKRLTEEAMGKNIAPEKPVEAKKPTINLDEHV